MSSALQVPGVYFEPNPRVPEPPFVRTDVAGFIGFETRVRDGTMPSGLVGSPPSGHSFQVDIAEFRLELEGFRLDVPGVRDFPLSQSASSTLLGDGTSIVFALAAAGAGIRLMVARG